MSSTLDDQEVSWSANYNDSNSINIAVTQFEGRPLPDYSYDELDATPFIQLKEANKEEVGVSTDGMPSLQRTNSMPDLGALALAGDLERVDLDSIPTMDDIRQNILNKYSRF